MFLSTSSCEDTVYIGEHVLGRMKGGGGGEESQTLFLDLKAKLARARALDKSMSKRKNGRASL